MFTDGAESHCKVRQGSLIGRFYTADASCTVQEGFGHFDLFSPDSALPRSMMDLESIDDIKANSESGE